SSSASPRKVLSMPLTDVACRHAKRAEGGKPRKLADGSGLYLLINPGREVLAVRLPVRRQAPDGWR
ncbi:MAG TPA: hypothetical protein PKA20_19655, partial [Burkholderiaceae bacterium]|nr:hypothetical protein [Burkholderiaceae bacterium]